MVLTHSRLNDLTLFHTVHKAVVYTERNTVAVGKVGEDSTLICVRRVLGYRPAAFVEVSADIVFGIEFHNARNYPVEIVLCIKDLLLLLCELLFLFHLYSRCFNFLQCLSPPDQIHLHPRCRESHHR